MKVAILSSDGSRNNLRMRGTCLTLQLRRRVRLMPAPRQLKLLQPKSQRLTLQLRRQIRLQPKSQRLTVQLRRQIRLQLQLVRMPGPRCAAFGTICSRRAGALLSSASPFSISDCVCGCRRFVSCLTPPFRHRSFMHSLEPVRWLEAFPKLTEIAIGKHKLQQGHPLVPRVAAEGQVVYPVVSGGRRSCSPATSFLFRL